MTLALQGDGWTLRAAVESDNRALCELFASVHLKGALDVTQERDPDFFALTRMHQPLSSDTGIATADDGRTVGCGTAIVREGWLDGRVIKTGYMCDLRVASDMRGGIHLARAFGTFMDWVRQERGAELFTTVIFDSNTQARDALTRRSDKRKEQPVYRPMTPFTMASIQFTTKKPAPTMDVGPASRDELVAFLAERSKTRVLGEVLTPARFDERLATWPNLSLSDFIVARDRGRIVGCLAPWDTGSFKRTRVLGYHGSMAWMRRAYNLAAAVRGFAPLPKPGEHFRFAFLSHFEADDPAVARALFLAAYARLRSRGLHFMSVCIPRGSGLEAALSGFMVNRTNMTLYVVHPPDSVHAAVDFTTLRPGFEMAIS